MNAEKKREKDPFTRGKQFKGFCLYFSQRRFFKSKEQGEDEESRGRGRNGGNAVGGGERGTPLLQRVLSPEDGSRPRASYEIYKQKGAVAWLFKQSKTMRARVGRYTGAFLECACPRGYARSRQAPTRTHHRLKKALSTVPRVYLAREGTSTRASLQSLSRRLFVGSFEIARIFRRNYVRRHSAGRTDRRWLATN